MEHCYTERLKKLLSSLEYLTEIVLKINSEIIIPNKMKQNNWQYSWTMTKVCAFIWAIRIAENFNLLL